MQENSIWGQLTPVVVDIKLDKKVQFFIEFFRYLIGVSNNPRKEKSENFNPLCYVYFVCLKKENAKRVN